MGDANNSSLNDYDTLAIPPLDPLFLSAQSSDENFATDLQFCLEDNCDFDISFDDIDDFYFNSENEQVMECNYESPESGISPNDVDQASKYLNSSPDEGSGNSDSNLCELGNELLNVPSPVSSQGSGNGGSGISDSGTNSVDQKIKIEENVNNNINKSGNVSKRKKESNNSGSNSEEDTSGETRNQKYRRSDNGNLNAKCSSFVTDIRNEEDEKRRARLMRNRESAQLSRQRKKHYVEELEDKVKSMHATIADLNGKISYFMAENATLRQQLSGNGMCSPLMYPPMAPMPYPWMPCAPYVVKPQGSQVPLVPIPRLKPQQPAPAAKSKKPDPKKGDGSKTKKVASVSFLGLLFFVLLFGGLVPIVDVKFGGVRENGISSFGSETFYDQHRGRVLRVGHSNDSHENYHKDYRNSRGRGKDGCLDEFSGHPLAASLYVPRNDKLVKIDGNLIIHSVLASEKAMSSHANPEGNNSKETGLAIPRDLSPSAIPGRYSHVHGHLSEPQKALTSGSGSSDTLKDYMKSSASDGKLQQWFHEGLAGPLLSSGMCSEVFQFDTSPKPGAIIPASSVSNITAERPQNSTKHSKGKNRRILRGLPIPLPGSDFNLTREHVESSQKENFQGNKSVSPMVVSVLVDPREFGDIEVEGVIKPKSISRIFVVVLLDSVKYVTYSCMLPRSGPHLVTA